MIEFNFRLTQTPKKKPIMEAESGEEGMKDPAVLIGQIEDCVGELIVTFSEQGSESLDICSKGKIESNFCIEKNTVFSIKCMFLFLGETVLNWLEEAAFGLQRFDIRHLDEGKNLIEELKLFSDFCAAFDDEKNDCKEKGVVRLMSKNIHHLEISLNKDWNSRLNSKTEASQWEFLKASPLKEKQLYTCGICQQTYKNSKYFQLHLRKDHESTEKIEQPRITCKLTDKNGKICGKKIKYDYINTHLRIQHDILKPTDKHSVRGFVSTDGRNSYNVAWCTKGEPDPTPSTWKQSQIPAQKKKDNSAPSSSASNQVVNKDAGLCISGQSKEVSDLQKNVITNYFVSVPKTSNQKAADGFDDSKQKSENIDSATLIGSHRVGAETTDDNTKENNPVDASNDKAEPSCSSGLEKSRPVSVEKSTTNVLEIVKDGLKDGDRKSSDGFHGFESQSVELEKLKVTIPSQTSSCEDEINKDNLSPDKRNKDVEQKKSFPLGSLSDELYLDDDEEEDENLDEDLGEKNDIYFEESDNPSFTKLRQRNQNRRYKKRDEEFNIVDVCDLEENKIVIQEFNQWLVKSSAGQSTISSSLRMLFTAKDSYLRFMKSLKADFSLDRLIDFHNGRRFISMKEPFLWLDHISGQDGKQKPGRRKEMLKCFMRLRRFVEVKFTSADFDGDMKSILRSDKIEKNLERIKSNVSSSKMWTKLEKLIQIEKRVTDEAKEIVDRDRAFKELNANKKYFASEEFKERENKMKKIWDEFETTKKKPKVRDFNSVGIFARNLLGFYDRNRPGCYQFTNSHWGKRRKVWYPSGTTEEDYFPGVPDGANVYEKPADKRPADAYTIRLTGENLKLKLSQPVTITINKHSMSWMLKYRDLKVSMFGKKTGLIFVRI